MDVTDGNNFFEINTFLRKQYGNGRRGLDRQTRNCPKK